MYVCMYLHSYAAKEQIVAVLMDTSLYDIQIRKCIYMYVSINAFLYVCMYMESRFRYDSTNNQTGV